MWNVINKSSVNKEMPLLTFYKELAIYSLAYHLNVQRKRNTVTAHINRQLNRLTEIKIAALARCPPQALSIYLNCNACHDHQLTRWCENYIAKCKHLIMNRFNLIAQLPGLISIATYLSILILDGPAYVDKGLLCLPNWQTIIIELLLAKGCLP